MVKQTSTKTTKIPQTSFLVGISIVLLRFLIIVILLGFLAGTIKTLLDLKLFLYSDVESALRQLLLNVIMLLAVIEIIKTAFSYLTEDRVKVTYIVDTVLIIMFNEIISAWFKGMTPLNIGVLIIIILSLMLVRFFAIKFSPETE